MEGKINSALTAVQGILTGIVVIVGIIAITKIVIKFLPLLDDPAEKNAMWKAIGSALIAVAAGAAAPWVVPWIFGLFQ